MKTIYFNACCVDRQKKFNFNQSKGPKNYWDNLLPKSMLHIERIQPNNSVIVWSAMYYLPFTN